MKNKLTILTIIISIVVAIFLIITLFFSPDVIRDKDLPTVYVFSAGGCPFCEEEMKYLRGLKYYNERFLVKEKELYVDHIKWEKGKDYELGYEVADLFKTKFGDDAKLRGTPYVVIGNVYAASGLNEDLETIIKDTYDSKYYIDVVDCVKNKGTDCLKEKKKGSLSASYLPVKIIELIVMITGFILIGLFIKLLKTK